MKTKDQKKNFFSIARINFLLLLLFTCLNDLDYLSTYLSIANGGIEINPLIRIMLDYPLIFFIWKILLVPMFVWMVVYESGSRKVMWSMVGVNLVYLGVVGGNFGVVF